MNDTPPESYEIHPVGTIRSPLRHAHQAARQGDEGAPPARIEITPSMIPALADLATGDRIVVLTWLHLADRLVLRTVPRSDPGRSAVGVFATRSQDRPNPIGLHPCTIVSIDGTGVEVDAMEAVDGTPVVDIKCALLPLPDR